MGAPLKCSVRGVAEQTPCKACCGYNAEFTYNLRSTPPQQEQESQTALQKQDCMQLEAKMANDEAAAAQYKSKDCESLLK